MSNDVCQCGRCYDCNLAPNDLRYCADCTEELTDAEFSAHGYTCAECARESANRLADCY